MLHPPIIASLYEYVLGTGTDGMERFHTAMRRRGIAPAPDAASGARNLYAPNPVILPSSLVEAMVEDGNRFCDALRELVPTGAALLERAPELVRDVFASQEAADAVVADLRRAHPFTSMDAFLVETSSGVDRAYLEWQTVGSYLSIGRWMVEAAAEAWPRLAEAGSLTATPGLSIAGLTERLRAIYLEGIEDDPRTGVVMDYLPDQQPTKHEFRAIAEISGGMGVIDPRQVIFQDGKPHYQRDGLLIPVRRVYSRLVYSEMLQMHREAGPAEVATLRRLFGDGTHVSWINHPLHFFYGAKADFPTFWAQELSTGLPETHLVTNDYVQRQLAELGSDGQLFGFVQKPTDLQSGRDVVRHPYVSQLRVGCVLQREINPASYHLTLYGPRTPEVRVMCLPNAEGRLIGGIVYNRIKAPEIFLSNAGHTAELAIPGTGEGYGIVVATTADQMA